MRADMRRCLEEIFMGRIVSGTDAAGSTISYTRNDLGLPLSLTNEMGFVFQYEYDPMGILTKIIDPNGSERLYSYDDLGMQIAETNPSGEIESYAYNVLKQRIQATRPDGRQIQYGYDAIGQLITLTLPESAIAMNYTYDDSFESILQMNHVRSEQVRTQDDAGRVIRIDTGNANDAMVLDPLASIEYEYNRDDRITDVEAPGESISVAYDSRGLIQRYITDSGRYTFTHDATRHLTDVAITPSDGQATAMTRVYSGSYQLLNLENKVGDDVIQNYMIELDPIGNRERIVTGEGVYEFSYDRLARLLSASDPQGNIESYEYDAVGNRVRSHFAGPATFDASHRILEDDLYRYEHSVNGNLTAKISKASGESHRYVYNALNQLVNYQELNAAGEVLTDAAYVYNPAGHRISKVVNGVLTRFLYDLAGELIAEFDADHELLASYIYGPEPQMPLSMNRGGELYVYHRDPQNSVVAITDRDGITVQTYRYDSYGRSLVGEGSIANPFRYTGSYFDEESGLYYMGSRYYSADLGRFLQQDPYHMASGYCYYTYARNNPVNFRDPNGRAGVGAIVGGGINLVGHAIKVYQNPNKKWYDLNVGSFVFDVGFSAATCGLGNALNASKFMVTSGGAMKTVAQGGAKLFVATSTAAAGGAGKELVLRGKVTKAGVMDSMFLFTGNLLGGGLTKDFDTLVGDVSANAFLTAAEIGKNTVVDAAGNTAISASTGPGKDWEWGPKATKKKVTN